MVDNCNYKEDYHRALTLPEEATAQQRRDRGYAFERILKGLLAADALEPRGGYKPVGEQIDGSFFFEGAVFLLEAKWHANPIPASALYQFKGKVDGKLIGTLGIFISMSGYSDDAVDALTLGKSLNLILFDRDDIDAAIIAERGFKEILKTKLRKAAEEGIVFYPTKGDVVSQEAIIASEIEKYPIDQIAPGACPPKNNQSVHPALVIVCEGAWDRQILSILVQRILRNENLSKRVEVIAALGKVAVPKVINSLMHQDAGITAIAVVDGDGDEAGTLSMLEQETHYRHFKTIIIEPDISAWFNPSAVAGGDQPAERRQALCVKASKKDLALLRRQSASFAKFYQAVVA